MKLDDVDIIVVVVVVVDDVGMILKINILRIK